MFRSQGGTIAIWSYGMGHLNNAAADKVLHRYHTETMGPYWSVSFAFAVCYDVCVQG